MKKVLWGIILLLIIILLSSSIIYLELQKDSSSEKEPEEELDESISPLENQGLILQINRIRHRGLLDKLMTPGASWKIQPRFYFISNIDGLEYISKNVSGINTSSTIFFEGWDTILRENKVMKDTPEEQKTSDITLAIMEQEKTGSLLRRFTDSEKEKIHLTYDYRTGHWEGDDSFMDRDGYGHYLGTNFEIWFNIYQTDYDHDGIPYWTEVNILHTDPRSDDSHCDPDGDAIPTPWEWKWGYNPHVWDDHRVLDPDIDGIENYEEYLMAPWFSDPFSPDIYMEIDYMEPSPTGVKHELWVESQQALIERFAQHGINVYIDAGWPNGPINGGGEEVTFYPTVSQESGMMLQYYTHHFDPARRGIFRYYVVGHSGSFTHPPLFNYYDTTHLGTGLIDRLVFEHLNFLRPSNLLKMLRAEYPLYYHLPTPRSQRLTIAAQFMHETGHQLGITPWGFEGCDNYSSYSTDIKELLRVAETWGNYHSVMNYFWLYRDKTLFDYSDGTHGENDQNDWLEIYLPNFQIESMPIIEDPDYKPPEPDRILNESGEFDPGGWVYSEQLTGDFIDYIAGYSPMSPIKVQWRVYVRNPLIPDAHYGGTSLRVYAQPLYSSTMIPKSEWTLISEGNIDPDGELSFSSQNLVTHK